MVTSAYSKCSVKKNLKSCLSNLKTVSNTSVIYYMQFRLDPRAVTVIATCRSIDISLSTCI